MNRRKQQREQEHQDTKAFKETWQSKLNNLHDIEADDERHRQQMNRSNQEELKRQMHEKQSRREAELRRELAEAEEAKANLENKDQQFKSYAEKCLKEWEKNGTNLYPIIKHLSSTMKATQ